MTSGLGSSSTLNRVVDLYRWELSCFMMKIFLPFQVEGWWIHPQPKAWQVCLNSQRWLASIGFTKKKLNPDIFFLILPFDCYKLKFVLIFTTSSSMSTDVKTKRPTKVIQQFVSTNRNTEKNVYASTLIFSSSYLLFLLLHLLSAFSGR